jgi:hypothetical protein
MGKVTLVSIIMQKSKNSHKYKEKITIADNKS